jgi:hypothetical protein
MESKAAATSSMEASAAAAHRTSAKAAMNWKIV